MAIDDGEAALNEVLDLLRRRVMLELRVALPARVNRVKAATGRVDLEVQLLLPRVNPEVEPDRAPILLDVPVLYPSSTECAIRFALAVGDPGLIVFADHALGSWLLAGDVVKPAVVAPHGLSGAAFLPGLWPNTGATTIPSEGVIVEVREGEALEVVGDEVRVGRGATQAAILGSAYRTAEDTMLDVLQAFLSAFATEASALLPTSATAATTANTAIASFQSGSSGYLGTVTKVK